MSNFGHGLSTVARHSGSTTTDLSLAANTKFIKRTAVIRCDAQTAETQTDFTLPATAIVHDVYLNVITADATETVDVGTMGTSNDPDGFLVGSSLAAAGVVAGDVTVTTGVNEVFLASSTIGALLASFTAGSDTAGDVGTFVRRQSLTAGGDPVSYTCSAGSDTAVFDIIIEYTEVVTE